LSAGITIYLLLAAMVLLWSGNYIVAKIVLREVPPMLVVALRAVIAGILIFPVYWRRLRRSGEWVSGRDLGQLLVLGFGGIAMNQFCFVVGIGKTSVTHSAIIMATVPLWVLLLATLLGMERVTVSKVSGMAMAIGGVLILQAFRAQHAFQSQPSGGSSPTMLGDFFVLLCALLMAGMTIFTKRWKPGESLSVVAVGYTAGAIAFAPVVWWQSLAFPLHAITPAIWAGILYMSALSSVVCYLIYNYALRYIAASRVAATQYMQPLLATMLAVMVLGERLTAPTIAAGGVIIAGVFVTESFE
jgi:drug/metabolite transporter (DMT)-like permease